MNIFADECIPPKHFNMLASLLQSRPQPIQARHLLDQFRSGELDDSWPERLAQQGDNPVVLTGDRHRSGRAIDPRLPIILPAVKLTGVFLTGKLQQSSGEIKMAAILTIIDSLGELVANIPPGERFTLRLHRERYTILPWPLNDRERELVERYRKLQRHPR